MSRLVIMESPYAGRGRWWLGKLWDHWRNIRYARRCMRDCLLRGESPMVSHLLYAQRGVLRDSFPAEREIGIDAGLAWGRVAEATVVYIDRGISPGMSYGIESARNRPVEYRMLDV